tara:strand:- start:990 stop:1283 length:294 start_codon:yes stop_codon:yes gene_type:complete
MAKKKWWERDASSNPQYAQMRADEKVDLGRRMYKKKKKKGVLYEGVDFSGSPTETPVDMFNRPQKFGTMANRRKRLKSALKSRRTFLDAPGEILTEG